VRAWVGIDVGAKGAAALLDEDGVLDVRPFVDVSASAALLVEWMAGHKIELAAVEMAAARPGQGVRSVFSFGTRFGEWAGLLSGLGVPFVIVPPQRWQKVAGLLPSDGDAKERSLMAARRRWPSVDLHRKGDDGRADSMHLAAFAKATSQGGT
jgi:crossover junction endodeoxyribonuclease RuvC